MFIRLQKTFTLNLTGRPTFSIDSLLQRKVVHNDQIDTTNCNLSNGESTKERYTKTDVNMMSLASPMIAASNSVQMPPISLPLMPTSMLPASSNPLESLTFENILRSAAIQHQKRRGDYKLVIAFELIYNLKDCLPLIHTYFYFLI